jgi:hypothetical protein
MALTTILSLTHSLTLTEEHEKELMTRLKKKEENTQKGKILKI